MSRIEMKKIPLFKVFMSDKAAIAASKVLSSGYIGQGEEVEKFETELKQFLNAEYVLTTNSATSAEHLALHLMKKKTDMWPGLNPGDEILCTPLTCTASNWPVLANNFKIKWVDIDPETLNMDLDDLERKISKNTKGVMLVHWGGSPNDLDRIDKIMTKSSYLFGFKPIIIEDCAHSLGATFNNKKLGSHGNICTYSLQAIKHVTSVDGGILVLPDKELYRRAKLLRWYGIDRDGNNKDFRCEADVEEWGFKFHMNDVCASIGRENLKYAEWIIEKHRQNAKIYDEQLKNVPGITLLKRNPNTESSFWIYSILVENKESFRRVMNEKGIVTSQVHERNDLHTCVKEYRTHLPSLDKTIKKVVSIPVGWWIEEEERNHIIKSIKEGW